MILQKASEYRGLIDWNQWWNLRTLKFNSQLRVKLHKSKTKNQNEKGVELQG